MPSQLLPIDKWPHDNLCTWAYDYYIFIKYNEYYILCYICIYIHYIQTKAMAEIIIQVDYLEKSYS